MTEGMDYTERLGRLANRRWKQVVNVQAPYRWNLRRLHLGTVLDVGCGLGRNLEHLQGRGVGVDHNPTSVQAACRAGLTAFTPTQFWASEFAEPEAFDSLLVAHVVEHLTVEQTTELYRTYLPQVKPGGTVVVITPQERGYASDPTHLRFVDSALAAAELRAVGVTARRVYSFPFPRIGGKFFTYNEFVTVGQRDVPS